MERPPTPISSGLEVRQGKTEDILRRASAAYAATAALLAILRDARAVELAKDVDHIDYGRLADLERQEASLEESAVALERILLQVPEVLDSLEAQRRAFENLLQGPESGGG